MDEILRFYKELRVVNCSNITARLLKVTDNDMFVAYNTIRDTYEIHSVYSFRHNKISINTTIDPDKLNQELIEIIKANSIKRFGIEILEGRDYINKLLDNREDVGFNNIYERGRKMIKLSLGREI